MGDIYYKGSIDQYLHNSFDLEQYFQVIHFYFLCFYKKEKLSEDLVQMQILLFLEMNEEHP